MKISIAMATYNGAKYLHQQLDSFIGQSRLPDELTVCDDLSSDETFDILRDFSQSAPFEVKIVRNEKNLGYTENFEKALSLSCGDIIFLSDQDDVWFCDKLEFVETIFRHNETTMVVVNDQELTDHTLTPSGLTISSGARAVGIDDWLSAGCCTALRTKFRDILTPFPAKLIAYDKWIHQMAHSFGVRTVTDRVLQYHRRHEANASHPGRKLQKPNRLVLLKEYGLKDSTLGWLTEIEVLEYMQGHLETKTHVLDELNLTKRAKSLIEFNAAKNKAIKTRIELVKTGHLGRLHNIFDFYRSGGYNYFAGWKSAIKDMLR